MSLYSPSTRRSWWLSTCVVCLPALLAGCGGSLPAASEPGQARELVTRALDAWKRGDKPESLASGSPSIQVRDREWGDGFALESYDLVGDGQKLGLTIQQGVSLQMKTPKGKALKKSINYVVTTGSYPMVARQDIDE